MEAFQSMKDEALVDCPVCGTPNLMRIISNGSGLIFKGNGFYLTDYKKGSSPATTSSPSKSRDESSKSDTVKTDAPKSEGTNTGAPKDGGSEKTDSPKSATVKSDTPSGGAAKGE
jgi:putative FmdB family regulatory protein